MTSKTKKIDIHYLHSSTIGKFPYGPWVDATPYVHLDDAVDAIGGKEERTLLISSPVELRKQTLDIPRNITLQFLRGGSIIIKKNQKLRVLGTIDAGCYQIFKVDNDNYDSLDLKNIPGFANAAWGGEDFGVIANAKPQSIYIPSNVTFKVFKPINMDGVYHVFGESKNIFKNGKSLRYGSVLISEVNIDNKVEGEDWEKMHVLKWSDPNSKWIHLENFGIKGCGKEADGIHFDSIDETKKSALKGFLIDSLYIENVGGNSIFAGNDLRDHVPPHEFVIQNCYLWSSVYRTQKAAIYIKTGIEITIRDNAIYYKGQYGIYMGGSNTIRIRDNTVVVSGESKINNSNARKGYGIYINPTDPAAFGPGTAHMISIDGNQIEPASDTMNWNNEGIFAQRTQNLAITNNRIISVSGCAIRVDKTAQPCVIENNAFGYYKQANGTDIQLEGEHQYFTYVKETVTKHFIPTSSLIAYYPFRLKANVANTVLDESGNGYHGKVCDANLSTSDGFGITSDRFGNPESSYRYNGQSGYIIVNNFTGLKKKFTFSVWLNVSSKGPNIQCFSCFAKSLDFKINKLIKKFDISDNNMSIWKPNFDINKFCEYWINITIIYYEIEKEYWISLYVNGSEIEKIKLTSPISIPKTDLFIGRHSNSVPLYFDGQIDDIRIYNSSLSDFYVKELYHEGGW